ncbi:MAG: DNA-binding domain-containing protein [Microcystis aeruginosa G13-07]|nr:DNA-binding domain-containing protein [Microcystis aeruginosa G13-07]
MGKPQIAVRIPPPLLAELNQYVERVGTSKTDVIVSAIAQYLGYDDSDKPLNQRVAELEERLSALETMVKEELKTKLLGEIKPCQA